MIKSEEKKLKEIEKHILSAFYPDKDLTVTEWADANRFLSQRASAEPGQWRTARTPYLKEIMDTLSSQDRTEMVVFMKGSQLGGTEVGNNWLGYIIDHVPGPMLLVQPTTEMAKRNSKQRIDPLISECPSLARKINVHVRKNQDNTVLGKNFPGGTLVMTGANSSTGLRSLPARYLFLDEVDAYPGDVGGEGDPVDLALARSRTFSKRKIFIVSTPTIHSVSRIEHYFEISDKRFYNVPCPECGEFQVLKFENLKWDWGDPSSVRYVCEFCKRKIENWEKTKLLLNGRWEKTQDSNIAGFHISTLYSPVGWFSWEDIAALWEKSYKNQEKTKAFYNTILGLPFKEKTDTPDWNRLYERRSTYKRNLVPKEVAFLTAGVDVQADRLEIEIVGWAKNKVSYSIDYRVLPGDTSQPEPWKQLEAIIYESFAVEGVEGKAKGLRAIAIDSGYATQTVYDFVRKFSPSKVFAVKGSDAMSVIIGQPKAVDVRRDGKVIRRGVKVWSVGVKIAKMELYTWLKQNAPIDGEEPPYGFCFFPEYGAEYFKMLTAEALKTKIIKGYRVSQFEKIRDRNEALDCRVYARAAAAIVGLDRLNDDGWEALKNDFDIAKRINKIQNKEKKAKKKRVSTWL